MKNIFCLSVAILASVLSVTHAAPVGDQLIDLSAIAKPAGLVPIPLAKYDDAIEEAMYNEGAPMHMMDNSQGANDNSQGSGMADPPLQYYKVKDIQNLSYPSLGRFFNDLIRYRQKTAPNSNIGKYINDLMAAFDKARHPSTKYTDNIIYGIIMGYRSFGYRLDGPTGDPERFKNYIHDLLTTYLPLVPAEDQKDLSRIIYGLNDTY